MKPNSCNDCESDKTHVKHVDLLMIRMQVECLDCGKTGPEAQQPNAAVKEWNKVNYET